MPKVKLGDVAVECRETCNGSKDGYPVVGLEHLIPEQITLTEWSDGGDNTFTKMFRKGQMLFGRRRAYLKKAALAPFDGICSGDITIIEAIPEKILPELLPFIIQNNDLFDFAVGKSAGSLSPRVKWEHLRNYEFDLPPLEDQKKLAELLWSANATKNAYKKLLSASDELVKSRFIEMFGDPLMVKATDGYALSDVCDLKAGKFVAADAISENNAGNLYPCFGGNGVRGYVADYTHDGEFPIIGRQGALCGNVQYAVGKFNATEHAVVVTPLQTMARLWLYYLLSLLNLNRLATGAAQPGLAVAKIGKVRVNVPEYQQQCAFASLSKQLDKSKFAINQSLERLEQCRNALMRKVFG